jgi:hypothetical protein
LPRFFEKNNIPKTAVDGSRLLTQLLENNNNQIVQQDSSGAYHFNGNFTNANSLKEALGNLSDQYAAMVAEEQNQLMNLFEDLFDHKSFTGRSGTFFGFEGLGSIYWHMVSKLALAVQEALWSSIHDKSSEEITKALRDHYYQVVDGIGAHKTPQVYGAFPTDPYSHTPAGRGAQQPGMTGQVKEDILCRWGEFGVSAHDGSLQFDPQIVREDEFLKQEEVFVYYDVHNNKQSIVIPSQALCFTYCQIPVVYHKNHSKTGIELTFTDGQNQLLETHQLTEAHSEKVFDRDGQIKQIQVYF